MLLELLQRMAKRTGPASSPRAPARTDAPKGLRANLFTLGVGGFLRGALKVQFFPDGLEALIEAPLPPANEDTLADRLAELLPREVESARYGSLAAGGDFRVILYGTEMQPGRVLVCEGVSRVSWELAALDTTSTAPVVEVVRVRFTSKRWET